MGNQVDWEYGEVREWLNRAVSKTVEPLRVPWVRIPPSPPHHNSVTTSHSDSTSIPAAVAIANGSATSIASVPILPYLEGMEVHFTPEQEAQLAHIASKSGTDPVHLVKEAALRLLEEDARFRAAVREGIAQADRGQFIEQEEM